MSIAEKTVAPLRSRVLPQARQLWLWLKDKNFDLVLQISLLRMLQASVECHVPATKCLTHSFTSLTFRLINATNPSCSGTTRIGLIDISNFKVLREHDHWSNIYSTKTELHWESTSKLWTQERSSVRQPSKSICRHLLAQLQNYNNKYWVESGKRTLVGRLASSPSWCKFWGLKRPKWRKQSN